MKLTNKLNLPPAFVEAVKAHDYDRGQCDFTATELISPPQQRHLRRMHKDSITEDVSDRYWALLGSAVHKVLELSAGSNELAERRLYFTLDDFNTGPVSVDSDTVTIGAQLDNLQLVNGVLSDYKMSSVWGAILGRDDNNRKQLLIQTLALWANDYEVEKIQNVYLYRDWSQTQAERDASYPQKPVEIVEYDLPEDNQIVATVRSLIKTHQQYEHGNPIFYCTEEERWHRGDKYALMKEGRKSALKVGDSESFIVDWAVANQPNALCPEDGDIVKPFYIEFRPGVSMRCERYCNVAEFCPQRIKQMANDPA